MTNYMSRWLEALENGNYDQCVGALRSTKGSFCVFGVLCDVINPDLWTKFKTFYVWDRQAGMPPASVLRLVGLTLTQAAQIAQANDDGCTFAELAKMIEAKEFQYAGV